MTNTIASNSLQKVLSGLLAAVVILVAVVAVVINSIGFGDNSNSCSKKATE